MKIVLFAHGEVGLEVVKHFATEGVAPELLIIVREDPVGNEVIRRATNALTIVEWSREPAPEQVEQLHALAPDLAIVAWWPYLLRPAVFSVPRLGCLNFHPSLLPHGRGKHPNFWALIESKPFGVSLQFIDAGVDSGDVAFQQPLPVSWEDTGGTLYHRARAAIVVLFKANFTRLMQGDIPRKPQVPTEGSFHRASELEGASQINLDKHYSARELLNLLRARTFAPHPGAWFEEAGVVYELRLDIKQRPQ